MREHLKPATAPGVDRSRRNERQRIEDALGLFRHAFAPIYTASIAKFDEITESTEPTNATDADAGAATIAIVLNQVLQDAAMRANVRGGAMLRVGPEFGSERLSRILWATSANARNYGDWNATAGFDPEAAYAVPMIVLGRTFGWPLPIRHLTSRTVLRRIGGSTYAGLEARVLETGLAIAKLGGP